MTGAAPDRPDAGDRLLDEDGPAAPPRANGELVFTAPWQSRLFGTTMRLREKELIDWEEFRRGLIGEIADHTAQLEDPDDYDYWGCWQRALEVVLDARRVVTADQLDAVVTTLANRPPDH